MKWARPSLTTWKDLSAEFSAVWKIGTNLPRGMLQDGDRAMTSRLAFEQGAAALFEPLRESQPRTWERLMHCDPMLLVRDGRRMFELDIAMASGALPVLVRPFEEIDMFHDWAEAFAALPPFMHSYYTTFNGMRASYTHPYHYRNLPAPLSRWRAVPEFRQEHKISKKLLHRMEAGLGDLDKVEIVIETDWKDLVVINKNRMDGRLYLVPRGDFGAFHELTEAQGTIDALCAHVVSGIGEAFAFAPL